MRKPSNNFQFQAPKDDESQDKTPVS